MFDIFGIRARRQAKREADEAARIAAQQERKRKYQERKAKIDAYLSEYHKKQFNITWEANKKHREFAEEQNSICPKCGSKNIINRVSRGKGEIHGEGHHSSEYSSSHFLFGSHSEYSSHGYSKLDGEFDTLPVNKCKDCGHEWHIKEPLRDREEDIFSQFEYENERLFDYVREYYELEYDPNDITEECNSLDEVIERFFEKTKDHWCLAKFRKVPRYMIDYALYQGMTKYSWHTRDLGGELGYREDLDEYSYVMPDDVWEIVKKIIHWEGNE
jgi:hypothetical protein